MEYISNSSEWWMTYTHSLALSSCKQYHRNTFLFDNCITALLDIYTNTITESTFCNKPSKSELRPHQQTVKTLTSAASVEQLILKNLGFFKESTLWVYLEAKARLDWNFIRIPKLVPKNGGKDEEEEESEGKEGKLPNWSVDISLSLSLSGWMKLTHTSEEKTQWIDLVY